MPVTSRSWRGRRRSSTNEWSNAHDSKSVVSRAPLGAGELNELSAALLHLVGRRLELGVARGVAAIASSEPLEVDALTDATVGVVGVEVGRRIEPVPEAVDVRGVGVDVLAERIRVLEKQAERLGVVGRFERARRAEERADALAAGRARGRAPRMTAFRIV